ncbi:MAG: dicarboxylate/amino acid:cation symporter [Aminipila sp.]
MGSELEKKSFWQNYRFPIILLIAIAVGSTLGIVMGEKATVFKPLGEVFINLMFTAVVPMVFVTIASAVGNMLNMKRLGKILGSMFFVFIVTGVIAAVIIFSVVTLFPPAEGANITMEAAGDIQQISLAEQIVKAITVNDFVGLMSKSNMLPLIVFSILFGFCVSAVGGEDNMIARGLDALSKIMMKLIGIIMLYAPIGLGAYFASLIGEFGPQLLGAYAKAMAIYYPVCFLYFIFAFALYAFVAGGKLGIKRCFENILPPAITAFATGSSIATLPVNLNAAEKMGVPKDIREIVLPMGATMHMDGTCLSSILKISFLFGVFGQDFTGIGTFFTAVLISVLGGVVMSGVPGGGLIGEMLIVNLYGFPPEAFPIIATIGFLVDPPATMVNATGDSVASMLVTRIVEGKKWLLNKSEE